MLFSHKKNEVSELYLILVMYVRTNVRFDIVGNNFLVLNFLSSYYSNY